MERIFLDYVLPCLWAFLACVGFTLVFNIHGVGKLICGFGGGLGWLVYLLAGSSIVAAFLAAVAIGVFSEIMARLRRCPVTGYLLVALLCVAGDTDRFLAELLHTFGMAAALAVGAMLASSVFRTVFPRLYHRPAGS